MSFYLKTVLLFSILFSSINAEEVRIAISDLLAGTLTDALMSDAQEKDIEYQIEIIGSLPALDKLNAGELDMALIAIPNLSLIHISEPTRPY